MFTFTGPRQLETTVPKNSHFSWDPEYPSDSNHKAIPEQLLGRSGASTTPARELYAVTAEHNHSNHWVHSLHSLPRDMVLLGRVEGVINCPATVHVSSIETLPSSSLARWMKSKWTTIGAHDKEVSNSLNLSLPTPFKKIQHLHRKKAQWKAGGYSTWLHLNSLWILFVHPSDWLWNNFSSSVVRFFLHLRNSRGLIIELSKTAPAISSMHPSQQQKQKENI